MMSQIHCTNGDINKKTFYVSGSKTSFYYCYIYVQYYYHYHYDVILITINIIIINYILIAIMDIINAYFNVN